MPLAGSIGTSRRSSQLPNDPFNTFQLSLLLGLRITDAFDNIGWRLRHETLIGELRFLTLDEAAEFFRFLFLASFLSLQVHEVCDRKVAVSIAQLKAD